MRLDRRSDANEWSAGDLARGLRVQDAALNSAGEVARAPLIYFRISIFSEASKLFLPRAPFGIMASRERVR